MYRKVLVPKEKGRATAAEVTLIATTKQFHASDKKFF